ncbi:MAG: thiamine pyrophosphate-requiring protein, partial [Alphaproteobacteria bacterium]
PLIESFAKAETQGAAVPAPIAIPHENVAMAMAIGYALVTGRPQAVMVHVNVGTANALCGLMNAARGDVPVLFTAGRTPITEKELRGARDIDIHWAQEMYDQAGGLRELVKWDYELRNGIQLETVIDRALTMSMSEPQGPVYLTLPREVLAEDIGDFSYTSPSPRRIQAGAGANPDAIDRAAAAIAAAERPLLITSSAGRNADCVAALGELADSFAIPVVQYRPRNMCLPSNHPMNAGGEPGSLLEQADVVVVVDCMVPWLPVRTAPPEDAIVIQMGPDPMFTNLPIRGFPCDIGISCSVVPGLRALTAALGEHSKAAAARIGTRRKAVEAAGAERADARRRTIERIKDETPIHPHWITHCISEMKDEDSVIVRESQFSPAFADLNQPGTFFKAGASAGLGVGLGVGLGAKLADREKLVIVTEGDGSYMFANPVSANYVSYAQKLPLLTVIYNNNKWDAVHRSSLGLNPDGFAAKSNRGPLTHFEGDARLEKSVEIHGGYGERVTAPGDLPRALDHARKIVENEGRQAVLNVVCSA